MAKRYLRQCLHQQVMLAKMDGTRKQSSWCSDLGLSSLCFQDFYFGLALNLSSWKIKSLLVGHLSPQLHISVSKFVCCKTMLQCKWDNTEGPMKSNIWSKLKCECRPALKSRRIRNAEGRGVPEVVPVFYFHDFCCPLSGTWMLIKSSLSLSWTQIGLPEKWKASSFFIFLFVVSPAFLNLRVV